jgi:hypothetical protein
LDKPKGEALEHDDCKEKQSNQQGITTPPISPHKYHTFTKLSDLAKINDMTRILFPLAIAWLPLQQPKSNNTCSKQIAKQNIRTPNAMLTFNKQIK